MVGLFLWGFSGSEVPTSPKSGRVGTRFAKVKLQIPLPRSIVIATLLRSE